MELDGETHGAVEHDVVRDRRRDHLMFAGGHPSDVVGFVLEHEAQGPVLDDEATPHPLGDLVRATQPGRSRVFVERRGRSLQGQPGR